MTTQEGAVRRVALRRSNFGANIKASFERTYLPMKDFFVSYTSADKAWAEWIAWHLEAAMYTTVLLHWDFRPGGNFALLMDRATREARATIAVLSPDYLQAGFPQPEWAAAFARDQGGSGI